jgi:hypothetical protein
VAVVPTSIARRGAGKPAFDRAACGRVRTGEHPLRLGEVLQAVAAAPPGGWLDHEQLLSAPRADRLFSAAPSYFLHSTRSNKSGRVTPR